MKTTDLIPLILHQLVSEDKYGYDIVKQIEDDSNGEINIKQPTLYSLLKKLEQSRFITSYWKDSEIGGKRHYYQITENGKAQISTYPSYETLIAECCEGTTEPIVPTQSFVPEGSQIPHPEVICSDEEPSPEVTEDSVTNTTDDSPTITHIDLLKDIQQSSPVDYSQNTEQNSVYSVEMPFKTGDEQKDVNSYSSNGSLFVSNEQNIQVDNSIEPSTTPRFDDHLATSTEENHPFTPINIFDAIDTPSPTPTQPQNNTLSVANSEVVSPTTSNEANNIQSIEQLSPAPQISANINQKLAQAVTDLNEPIVNEAIEQEFKIIDHDSIQYVNYVDLKTDPSAHKRRQMLKAGTVKMTLTTMTLLIILAITLALAIKISFTSIYCISLAISGLIILFYPLLFASTKTKLRLKYCSRPLEYNAVMDFFIKLSLFLILAILIFAYNIKICDTFADIFTFSNLPNILSPILLSSVLLIDFGYSYLCFKNFKATKNNEK